MREKSIPRRSLESTPWTPSLQSIEVSVDADGETRSVRVLPAPHFANKLCVECVDTALAVLLQMPDGVEETPFIPEIPCECPNVAWRGGIEATLVTRFWSEGKWTYSHKSVPRGDSDEDTWSQRVRDASLLLQDVFARKHAPPSAVGVEEQAVIDGELRAHGGS